MLAVVRLIFWCVTVVVCKKAIWMFPNLFEDVGFVSLVFNLLVSIPIPVFDICIKMGKEEKRVTVRIQEKDQDKGTIKCSPDHILILHLVPLPLDSIHRSLPPEVEHENKANIQFESFVPVWAYDEPKQKKKKSKSSSSKRSSKSSGGEKSAGEEGEASKGQSSATDLPSTAGLSQRQGATVEEIDDDEA